jgi:NAD(P)-dependent dehydrogenase (short-subunit alcohol dehydrogenase family)
VSLKGKTAIVTGGSRGIGRAIAEKLAERGAAVVVNYTLSSAAAAEVAQAITKAGGKAIAVQADVSKAADVKRLFAETEKAFGKPALVVANAGVFAQKATADSTDEDFDNIFNINARGAFSRCAKRRARCRTAAASWLSPPVAPSCSWRERGPIWAARAQWSSLSALSLTNWPSARSRSTRCLLGIPKRTCCRTSFATSLRPHRHSSASVQHKRSRMSWPFWPVPKRAG